MKNNISVNAKYYKASQYQKILDHNLRKSKIDYLLKNEHITHKNQDFSFNDFKDLQQNKTKILKEKFNYKQNKNENELVDFVIALSEEQALEYLKNGKNLKDGFLEFTKQIKEKYGFEPLNLSIHLDEGYVKDEKVHYNIHAHATFFNFDFEKQQSVLRNMKKKDWENMQDIAQNSFQKHDLDFLRGESKKTTKKQHLEKIDFVLKQKSEELKELYNLLNNGKNSLKNISKTFDKKTNEYKVLRTLIKNLEQNEKKARLEYKNISELLKEKEQKIELIEEKVEEHEKWLDETKKDLKDFLISHILKNEKNKYEIKDMQLFYNEFLDLSLYLSNFDLKLEELEKTKALNAILQQQLNSFVAKNEETNEEKIRQKNKIDDLIKQKNALEDENYSYKKFISEENLEDDFNASLKSEEQHTHEMKER